MAVIPIEIGALGIVTKGFVQGLEDLEIRGRVGTIQTTVLVRSTKILRRVQETCCHLNSSEKPSTHADIKNSQKSKIIGKILEQKTKQNRNAEWISIMKKELKELKEGPEVNILFDSLKVKPQKIPNWKTLGHDGIQGFYFEKSHFHSRKTGPATELMSTRNTHTRMDDKWGKIPRSQKTPTQKRDYPSIYRPITCFLIMWKILTALLRGGIYYSLLYRRVARGTNDLLYINYLLLKETTTRYWLPTQNSMILSWKRE